MKTLNPEPLQVYLQEKAKAVAEANAALGVEAGETVFLKLDAKSGNKEIVLSWKSPMEQAVENARLSAAKHKGKGGKGCLSSEEQKLS